MLEGGAAVCAPCDFTESHDEMNGERATQVCQTPGTHGSVDNARTSRVSEAIESQETYVDVVNRLYFMYCPTGKVPKGKS